MKIKPTVVKARKNLTGTYKDSESKVGYAIATAKDIEMMDAEDAVDESEADSDEAEEEITLADRVTALETKAAQKRATPNGKSRKASQSAPAVPAIGSLSTVLTQALKTNDQALLESCLSYADPNVIRQTIIRLDPPLSVALLDRLAERIARTPARTAQLTVWMRYVMVVHGGYLVSLPNLVNTLTTVRNALSRNAGTLSRLLALQGRLDMLSAQIELRRDMKDEDFDNEVDSDIEYVEGAEDEIVLDDAGYIAGEEDDEDGDLIDDEAEEDDDDEGEEEEDED
ncbi:Dip2/Utp12 family-domain-containing protein [Lipomyces arxii]|uniref:Dip2/Utp12 family-domain-containing protein n=1 Tax=Lipomyces arxii TaxID=56418 RepID=UPI0034CE7187